MSDLFFHWIYKLDQIQNRELFNLYESDIFFRNLQLGFGDIPMREGEMMKVEVDNRALKDLGWRVTKNIENGLKKLIGLDSRCARIKNYERSVS